MVQELELVVGELKKVVFKFDTDNIEKLKIIAAKKRTTQNDCFNEAMQDFFKKYKELLK
jgi:hypothetical protein